MKKQVLIGSVLLAAISTFSQNSSRAVRTGMINTKILAETKFGPESPAPLANTTTVKPTVTVKSGAKTTSTFAWQNISSSMNIYGVIISYCKPLQWNDELNAVSFVQRKSPTYSISPTPATTAANGGMVAMITTDCGTHWDSTALFSNDNFWGRYPGGAIYNPTGNTSLSNAYIVGAGPTTGPSATTWIGNWYASKKLATYDNIPSTAPGAQQVMPTGAPFSPGVPSRHDFAAYNFTSTDDGKMRVLAGIQDDALSPASDTAVMLMTGTFNSSTNVFDWAGRIFDPPVIVAPADGSDNMGPRYIMAWNELGTIGYVVTFGSRSGATGSNVGIQPIVYKTTNSGSTWSLESSINFNSATYNDVKNRIWGVNTDSTLKVPNFNWLEGMDAAVDFNGKLHIFTSILGHPSNDPDSLGFISQWTTEKYLWPHAPTTASNGMALHPFLWDFVYDGTATTPAWSHVLVDSMSTEGPQATTTGAGYQDNPWDPDPSQSNQKVRIDARLQISRTPDGKHLLYSWSQSDTAFTNNQKKWNNLPNIKLRLFDAEFNQWSPDQIDITTDITPEVSNHAMYQFVAPKFKLVSKTASAIDIMVPATVSNSDPYAQLTTNKHWYACVSSTFSRPSTVGIVENSRKSADNSSIYPNPAKNNAIVKMNLVGSSKVQVEVVNAMGQVVKASQAQGQIGVNSINIDLSGLASGIYFVNVKVDNSISTKKLIVE